jgi:hypothetical protein
MTRRGSGKATALLGAPTASALRNDVPSEQASDRISSRLDAAPAAGSASGSVAAARTAEYFAREARPLE